MARRVAGPVPSDEEMGRSWTPNDEQAAEPRPSVLEQLRVWWRRRRLVDATPQEAPAPPPEPAPETT
jgi:hypothetical protein